MEMNTISMYPLAFKRIPSTAPSLRRILKNSLVTTIVPTTFPIILRNDRKNAVPIILPAPFPVRSLRLYLTKTPEKYNGRIIWCTGNMSLSNTVLAVGPLLGKASPRKKLTEMLLYPINSMPKLSTPTIINRSHTSKLLM